MSRWPLMLAGAGFVLYVGVFFVLRLRLYDGLYIGLWDQGFIQQALYNTLHGNPLAISVSHEGYTHLFAEHFFLFALALLPFYALAPVPATLFLLETVAAGAGGLALYFVARRRLGNGWLALAVSLAYLLHPTLEWANLGLVWYGFHLENFFPPLFLLGIWAWDARRLRLAVGLLVLSLTVAELFAIPVALYALARAARHREDRFVGLAVLAIAAAWFLFATLVVMPYFRGGLAPRQFTGIALLLDLVRRGDFADYLSRYDESAGQYLVFLLRPFGFLPLAGPGPLLAAVPSILLNFLGPLVGNELPVRPQAWYSAAVLPLFALAAVDGVDHILRGAKHLGWERHAVRLVPLVMMAGALTASYTESPLPFSQAEYIEPRWLYFVDDRSQLVDQVRTLIPEEASVSAEFFLGAHLLNREGLYWFPRRWQESDYVAVDLRPRFPLSPQDLGIVQQLRSNPGYELIYDESDILVFHHRRTP